MAVKNKNPLKKYIWTIFYIVLFIILIILLKYSEAAKELNTQLFYSIYAPNIFWKTITHAADTVTIVILTLIVSLIFLIKKQKKEALFFILVMIIGNFFSRLIRSLIDIPRPAENALLCKASPFSFPSGHAFAIILFFGALYLLVKNKKNIYLWLAVIFGIIIGLSRISLGCHWPLDILGSIVFAMFILSFFNIIEQEYLNKKPTK